MSHLKDRRRDGGTNFILRIKEQETRLTLHEHEDGDEMWRKLRSESHLRALLRYGRHCADFR